LDQTVGISKNKLDCSGLSLTFFSVGLQTKMDKV
jgi:hypothetical protein